MVLHCRHCKLLDLIQQELAERGQSDTVLQEMTKLNEHALGGGSCLDPGQACSASVAAPGNVVSATQSAQADETRYLAQDTKIVVHSPETGAGTCLTSDACTVQPPHGCTSSATFVSVNTATSSSTADAVLAAAMAAYKQEKRQLWKVSLLQALYCMQYEHSAHLARSCIRMIG